jgi:hypothetical protein
MQVGITLKKGKAVPDRRELISLRLSSEEKAILSELADADMRPLSAYIRVLLMEAVPEERKRLRIQPKAS